MNAPLFSRPIRVEAIPRDGLETRIEADPAERAALARFNGLPMIGALAATFSLKHGAGEGVIVHGELTANVTQSCVVTLEPFEQSIEVPIELRFAPPADERLRSIAAEGESEEIVIGEEDEPDPIVDGVIDLGAVASEFLTLNLDPYPRKPGVAFEPPDSGEDRRSASPFSALAERKKDE